MKPIIYLTICLLFITACKKTPYSSEFETSLQKWNSYKKSINNSYSYISYSGSVFGSHVETKITVQNGVVIGREYTAGTYAQNSNVLTVTQTWAENASTLNTHTEGTEAITLDAVYAKAKSTYLSADQNANNIYFSVDSNGLIAGCSYVPKGCMDDCARGVNIKSITAL